MSLIKTKGECISYARHMIKQYRNLNEIVKDSDYIIWGRQLEGVEDIDIYIMGTLGKAVPFKLFNTAVIAALNLENPIIDEAKNQLARLDSIFVQFPKLKSNTDFKKIVKTRDLTTINEMTIISYTAK